MVRIIIGGLIILITQSFFLLEEETLILIASIVWLDAAGGLIRKALETELEGKGDKIKEKFTWYLTTKIKLLELLILKHEERKKIAEEIQNIYSLYVEKLLEISLTNYAKDLIIVSRDEIKNDILLVGKQVINDISLQELEKLLNVVEDPNIGEKNWFGNNRLL